MPISNFAIVPRSDKTSMPTAEPESPIARYILRVMREQDLKPVDVLKNAKRLKIKLSQPTFQEIYSGNTPNPQIYTLINISKALGRPFQEMVAEIEGVALDASAFRQSKAALIYEMYEKLNAKEKKIADRFLDMVERELTELLKLQGESNLIQLRK